VQRALDRLTIQVSLVGKDVQYHYVLELPTLWILKYFKSPVIEGRDGYIVALLNNIGDAWAGTAKEDGHPTLAAPQRARVQESERSTGAHRGMAPRLQRASTKTLLNSGITSPALDKRP